MAINRGAATKRPVLLVLLLACVTSAYAESVPLKREGGTYVVPVLINGKITLDFTLDSGAADVSIPADVFSTMVRTKTVAQSDLMGTQVYVLADGSEQSSQRFRIRSLKVGSLELHDVVGSVSPAAGTLLLGQSFLSRIKSWSIDNERHVFVFNETTPRAAADAAAKRPSATAKRPPPTATRPAAVVPPPTSTTQADDEVLQKAVNYFFTGDELRSIEVVDRANCIFKLKNNFDKYLGTNIHLNNVDRARSKISRESKVDSYGHLTHSVLIVLRGEGVNESPAAPAHTNTSYDWATDEKKEYAVPASEASFRSEYTFSVYTDEYDRVVRAWNYICSHGCKERKSSF